MRWQWVARVAVAVVGLTCATAIYMYTRNAPKPKDPQPLARVDPDAVFGGTGGRMTIQRTGKSNVELSFRSTTVYKNGQTAYNDTNVVGLEGSRFTLHCDLLELREQPAGTERPKVYDLKGHVKITTDDGLQLEAEQGSYDDGTGVLSVPGAVTFAKGRVTGHAVGATYDRAQDAFQFLDQAAAKVAPDEKKQGAADATSTRMSMVRAQHALVMDGRAKIVGDTQTMAGDRATVSFTDDEQSVKLIELRGSGRVTPNPGRSNDQPGMSADNVTMAFLPDGVTLQHANLTGHANLAMAGAAGRSIAASWIDLAIGPDGHTLTAITARDQVVVTLAATAEAPGRTITATSLVSTGDPQKGLTSATFEGDPRFTETPRSGPQANGATAPAVQTGSAKTLVLTLAGQLDAIESAEFQQDAKFTSGDATGFADVALYDEAHKTLKLRSNPKGPKKQPHATTAEMSVYAWEIDFDTEKQNLDARRGVVTSSSQAKKPGPQPANGLFTSDTINGASDSLKYIKSTGTATYLGLAKDPAQLVQGKTRVLAREIVFVNETRVLNANGGVDSIWELDTAPEGSKTQVLKTYRVRAETLRYVEADRTAEYTAAPVNLTRSDGDIELEARKLTFRLAATSRTLEQMVAETDAWAKMADGGEVSANIVIYDAATDTYRLLGKSGAKITAKVKKVEPASTPKGEPTCSLTEAIKINLNRKTGEIHIDEPGQAPKSNTPMASCSESLRRSK